MFKTLRPWQLLIVAAAGWVNQDQQTIISYSQEENRVLGEQLGRKRLRLSDDQRRRLAAKGKLLGRRIPADIASIVSPNTILAWHRRLLPVYFAGATPNPNTKWMMQLARNLIDPFDGFVSGKRFIIIDRDRKYCDAFRAMLRDSGTESLRLESERPAGWRGAANRQR
jgi:hypothetical protein